MIYFGKSLTPFLLCWTSSTCPKSNAVLGKGMGVSGGKYVSSVMSANPEGLVTCTQLLNNLQSIMLVSARPS